MLQTILLIIIYVSFGIAAYYLLAALATLIFGGGFALWAGADVKVKAAVIGVIGLSVASIITYYAEKTEKLEPVLKERKEIYLSLLSGLRSCNTQKEWVDKVLSEEMIEIAQYSSDDVMNLVSELNKSKENTQADNIFKLLYMLRKEAKLPKIKEGQHTNFVRIGFIPPNMEIPLTESEKE